MVPNHTPRASNGDYVYAHLEPTVLDESGYPYKWTVCPNCDDRFCVTLPWPGRIRCECGALVKLIYPEVTT